MGGVGWGVRDKRDVSMGVMHGGGNKGSVVAVANVNPCNNQSMKLTIAGAKANP